MDIKKINHVIISKSIIIIIFLSLFLYALMSLRFDYQIICAEEFIVRFYQQLNTFFIQVPLILILIISSYIKFHNEMIIVRFESHIRLFKAELIMAALISIIYIFLIVLIEIIFIFLTSGIPNLSFILNFLISTFIQTLTVFFLVSLYIMLRKISSIPIIIIIFVLGIDAYTTIVRTPVFPESFNIFISTMCCFAEYIMFPENNNYLYYLCLSVLKIAIVIFFTFISIWITRRDYFAQK